MEEMVKEQESTVFTKKQLMQARRFAEKRDILQVLLKEDRKYSIVETQRLIEKFLQRKVK